MHQLKKKNNCFGLLKSHFIYLYNHFYNTPYISFFILDIMLKQSLFFLNKPN